MDQIITVKFINLYSTEWIHFRKTILLHRGCQQGDMVSTYQYMFAIAEEIRAASVREKEL